jgi:hypothetical protein
MTRFARVGVPYVVVGARTGARHWDPCCWRGIVGVPLLDRPCIGFVQTVHHVALRVLILRLLSRLASRVAEGRAVIERCVCDVSLPCYSCLWLLWWW